VFFTAFSTRKLKESSEVTPPTVDIMVCVPVKEVDVTQRSPGNNVMHLLGSPVQRVPPNLSVILLILRFDKRTRVFRRSWNIDGSY
jgi:hypothetical protein